VRALAALATGPPRTVDIGSPMMSSLERSITDNLFVDERLAIQPGEARVFVLGNSSDHGKGPLLSLEIRVN
ncbi:MAG: hypothetical protein O7B99_06980, partial [Planctomycetota bacterium]|nr:hypothetical protein [Planctomycetota bacterium]